MSFLHAKQLAIPEVSGSASSSALRPTRKSGTTRLVASWADYVAGLLGQRTSKPMQDRVICVLLSF